MTDIELAKTTLTDVFDRYRSMGIVSIYLWGSILTSDYVNGTSDVDAIAIVDDDFPFELELSICEQLPCERLKKFSLRLLYTSELNGGDIKGFIAKVIHPALLLFDLPNWQLVAGQPVDIPSFKLAGITVKDAIRLRVDETSRRWPDLSHISELDHTYFVKEVARILDLMQQLRTKTRTPFSYTKITECARNGDETERQVATSIASSRASGWDYDIFCSNLSYYVNFIAKVRDI